MSFKTIQDVKKYILVEYGVSPISMKLNKDDESIDYKALNIKLNKSEIRVDKKVVDDMWTVKRKGHSIDFFRTTELAQALAPGGSLLYFIMDETESR
jgi:hypothetical protein